jgi:glycosyltransferase involved in cell wall biosynthesis
MEEKYKVSAIVPVYNVSNYLRQCINSILDQELEDLELILINDKSPDPIDHKICKEYSEEYENVKYIRHKKNKNLGGARNSGLTVAEGEYISFIDSDDWIDEKMYSEMYKIAKKHKASIINCGMVREYENGKPTSELNANKEGEVIIWNGLLDRFLKARAGIVKESFPASACNKLYKRDFLINNSLFFQEGYFFEETMYSIETFANAEKMVLLPQSFYHWRIREGSISTTVTPRHIDSIFYVYRYTKELLLSKGVYSNEMSTLVEKFFYNLMFKLYLSNNIAESRDYIPLISEKLLDLLGETNILEYIIEDYLKYKSDNKKLKKKVTNLRNNPSLKFYKKLSRLKRKLLRLFVSNKE